MPRRRGALFLPLDTRFFEDDRIVAAGEAASWLFLAICCKSKSLETDGELTLGQVERLGIKTWRKRLDLLVKEGAVDEIDGRVQVRSWLNHNDPSVRVRARRQADSERKAVRRSARSPDIVGSDSERSRDVEVETEVETEPPTPHSGGHDGTHKNCRTCRTNPRAEHPEADPDAWMIRRPEQ